jgi:predicted permease
MERLFQDLRFAVRLLLKDRAFTLTALLTLAICIGANATIFSVVNSVLLRPLPVREPERLVLMHNSYPRAGVERASNGVPDYYDRLRELQAFEEQALYDTRGLTVGIEGDPRRMPGMAATPSLLRMLGAAPLHGRIFTEAEGELGNDRKVVLTYGLWQELYAGSADAVGREVRIDGQPFAIVGVLPAGFEFLDPEVRLWIPAAFSVYEKSDDARHSNNWSMVGRLRTGATAAQAQQQLDALNARNMERFPHFKEILTNAGFHSVAVPLQEDLVRSIRRTLYLLWGGVLFVLLIGVVNITNLMLVRSSGRAKELATRQALGAGLGRLTRQLLTETVLLTVAGGLLGLAVGYWGVSALSALGLERLPRGTEVRLDGVAAAFTLLLALAVGMVVALVPVVSMRQVNLSQAFREESRSGTSGRGTRLVRRSLVTAQVAFAFMLLIGAGLLLASFQRVLAIDPGFEPASVLTARVAPPESRYPDSQDSQALRNFTGRFLERLRTLPGVQQVGITSSVPFSGDSSDSVILAEGYQMAPGESLISPFNTSVSPGYFESMGIALRSGRFFNDSDTEHSPNVVIVDERLARRFWRDTNPLGRRMYSPGSAQDLTKPGPDSRWYTVVGVVSEIRMSGLVEIDDRVGAYYFPLAQQPRRNLGLTIRADSNSTAITPAIRRTLAEIDPELPLFGVLTMQERLEETLVDRRTPMVLATVFGAVALFLAAVGIYGVLAYQVAQRAREIGIRMALGSDAWRVFLLILSEGLLLLGAGLVLGIIGAFSIRSALESQLYGVSPMDPFVLGSVAIVLGLVSLTACAVPARRAARIDPVIALNQ